MFDVIYRNVIQTSVLYIEIDFKLIKQTIDERNDNFSSCAAPLMISKDLILYTNVVAFLLRVTENRFITVPDIERKRHY